MAQFVFGQRARGSLSRWLREKNACEEAWRWLAALPPATPLVGAVEQCPRGDWLLWFAEALGVDRDSLQPVIESILTRGMREYLSRLVQMADLPAFDVELTGWACGADRAALKSLSRRLYRAAHEMRAAAHNVMHTTEVNSVEQTRARDQYDVTALLMREALTLPGMLDVESWFLAVEVSTWAMYTESRLTPEARCAAYYAEGRRGAEDARAALKSHPVWMVAIADFGVVGSGFDIPNE